MRPDRALEIVKAIRRPEQPEKPSLLRHTEIVGDRPSPTGFIYFVYCAARIKIGYTGNVASRMVTLANSSPFPITLLMTITGSPEDERQFHNLFGRCFT